MTGYIAIVSILYTYCGRCGRQVSPPISKRDETTAFQGCHCPAVVDARVALLFGLLALDSMDAKEASGGH